MNQPSAYRSLCFGSWAWESPIALPAKNRVRLRRTDCEWSQGELAEKLAVSRQTINAIETEKIDPSLPLALKIGKLCKRPVEEIFIG